MRYMEPSADFLTSLSHNCNVCSYFAASDWLAACSFLLLFVTNIIVPHESCIYHELRQKACSTDEPHVKDVMKTEITC